MQLKSQEMRKQKKAVSEHVITVPISATVKAREQMESTTVWPAVR